MKIPRYLSPAAIPETRTALPAVSAVVANGFLCASAPVARFGGPKDAVVYLLLSVEQRRSLEAAVPDFHDLSDRMAPDFTRYAVLRANGSRGIWMNAENLWVAVPWLIGLGTRIKNETHGSALVYELARIADS